MKKIFSLILSLAMLLTITSGLNLTAYADSSQYGNIYYEEKEDGTIEITGCTSSATSINIPSTIVGKAVTSIRNCAFYGCKSLTSVTIPNSVTSIGDSAFYSCTSLTNVTIPNSVTSIGDWAFFNCTSLTSIIIPNSVTSIGKSAFKSCISLASVKIPDSVTSIGDQAFDDCESLTSVTIPDSVTSIGDWAFSFCERLTSVTIPDSVTSIGDSAFSYCANLIRINVGENNINYFSVNGVLFNRNQNELMCYPAGKKDKNYEIPKGVTSIGDASFYACKSLTNITIPNGVTSIGCDAFEYCDSLASVTIPNSVTSIGDSAFENCTSLTSIIIPNSVTSIGSSAFYNCKSLTKVDYNGTVSQWKSIKGYDNVSKIIKCTDGIVGNGNTVTIDNLKYKIYHDTASLVGYTDSPENLVISKNISYEGYTLNVTSISESAFRGCTSLTSVTVPDSVTSIGDSAFYGCTNLTSITIPNSVTSIGLRVFYYCRSLTSVTIPNSVTSIGRSAFYYCRSLTSVTIPDSVISIGDSAFFGCINLTSVTIPDSVTVIGSNAFYDTPYYNDKSNWINGVLYMSNCLLNTNNDFNFTNNYIVENSTRVIAGSAFYGCTSLTSVTIPNSVTNIGDYAFKDCTGLTSIIVLTPDCEFGSHIVERNVKIYGFANSTANKYANSYGNEFIEIYCNDYSMEHNYISNVLTQPTCTKKGVTRYTCSRCGYSYDEENIEALGDLGHNYVSKVIKQPTCTAKGTTRYTCSYCGDYYDKEDIAALGHKYVSKVLTQPTCTEKGTTRYTCSRCSDSYDKDNIAALGHKYVSKVLTQPTCTEKGTTRYTCSRCGDYYDKDDIAALGHNYVSKVLTQPTCTEKGTTRYTCTRCNNYYDKEDIEELGHDTKIVERVEPTLTEDGFYRVECQRDGCGYSSSHPLEQLTLGYNQKVKSNGSDTYKIEMDKSGYLIFDFEGESKEWDINIYDEDYNKIDTLKPVYKEFYKKSYLQISLGSSVPNKNQMVALFAGKYYVEIDRLNNATNDNFSGNYTFSIDYSPANETIKETKNDFYYDAPTAKNIELNKTYNGFLGAKYACYNYVGNPILTTDERDAYKIEIPKGSGLSQFSVTLSSKAFAPLGSNCTLILYNSKFEPYDGFKPLTVSLNSTLNETIYLYEGTYYIAVVNDNSPIEYTFTTTFKPQGTFTCVEHKGKLVNTVNPTCTQNGYNSYVCQICGAQYNEIIPAYGHNAVIDYEVAPTLVSSGLTRGSHCSICGAVITPQTVIPKISAPTQPTITPTTAAKAVAKPKSAKIKKVKAAKKAVSVEWKKVSGVKGYQVEVAIDKKFKKNKKTATVKKQKTTKVTIKKLKAKKKYYVRIRTYKTVKGKKIYSSWSKVKKVKTK